MAITVLKAGIYVLIQSAELGVIVGHLKGNEEKK